MVRLLARLVPALVPLAAGLLLLRRMPEVAVGSTAAGTILRLDPLALAACVLLPLGAARPETTFVRELRLALGVVGAIVSVGVAPPLLQLATLLLVSSIIFAHVGSRWFTALAALTVGLLLPEMAERWHAPPGVEGAVPFVLFVVAFAGLGCIPRRTRRDEHADWELVLRPLWLFPLLRSLEAGPWPVGLALFAQLAAATAVLAAAVDALTTTSEARRRERTLGGLLGMALLCTALNTAPGVAGALWALCAHAVLLLFLRGQPQTVPGAALLWLWLPLWWTAGAAAAAGGFLVAAMVSFAGIALAVTVTIGPKAAALRGTDRIGTIGAAGLGLLLMLFAPAITRFVALPVIDQLGAGLTAFGLLEVWPWIGIGIQDAGHRRVAVTPSVALVALLGVIVAVLWLLLRAVGRNLSPALTFADADGPTPFERIRSRVWWARPHGDG